MDDAGDPAEPPLAATYRCTFGIYNQVEPWTDVRELTWPTLAKLLTAHEIGHKEGTCIVPAVFRGTMRQKANADRIDVALLDSDCGHTRADIDHAVRRHGLAAIISSTHSHLTTRTHAKRGNWDKFKLTCEDADNPAAAFLIDKGYLASVAEGARIVEETDEYVVFEHQPCPKFRIAIPLLRPWLAAAHDGQRAANAVWKERIEALAAALRLNHDQACTDTSRLFYLPRRAIDGPPPETAVIDGKPCDLFGLPPRPDPTKSGAKAKAGTDRRNDRRGHGPDPLTFADPETGENVDLRDWARRYAGRFEIVAALKARHPAALTGKIAEETKYHLHCVNEEEHTQAGADAATFVVNASRSTSTGFVYHCRHAHCDNRDRLFFVRRMLHEKWLTIADLTEPTFLSGDALNGAPRDAQTTAHEIKQLEIGSDAEVAGRVANDLIERLGPVVHDEGEFWRYNGLHWEAIPPEPLWRAVFVYDGASFDSPKGDPANVKVSEGRVKSVLACMVPLLIRSRFFADAAVGINCSSGFISFASDGAPSIAPHCSDHRRRHVIAGRWPRNHSEETKRASLLYRLLDGCFRDDDDKRAKIDLLAEVGGVAALGRATRISQPKALVCFGKLADNGKSQVLAMLRSLLPSGAVSSISPGRFDDRTFVCHLVAKLLNAPDELGSTEAITSDIFKQIITGDPLMVRDVYSKAFEFKPSAQHVFATNVLPTFKGGMDRGVRRRLMVLVFNRVIPKEEQLEGIGHRIGVDEPDLLLDWIVRGAGRVIAARTFTTPTSSAEALLEWMYSSDPVPAWLVSDEVEFPTNGSVLKTFVSVAHRRFMSWALGAGFARDRLPAVNGFSQRVEAAGKGVTKKRTSAGAHFVGLGCRGVRNNQTPDPPEK